MEGELDEPSPSFRIDRAAVRRTGGDVTLVTYGGSLPKTLAAAEQLAREGIDAVVIDLRSLRPLDMPAVLESVVKTHRAVIVASHPSRAARLVGHLPSMAHVLERLKPLTYEPIVTVYLQYARAPCMGFPMIGFVDACTQWLFDRGAISGHEGLLAAVISASGRHQSHTHRTLAQQVHAEIAAAFPCVGSPQWTQVIEEKRATFACVPDLERPDQRTPIPGLFLAGDYTRSDYPATLEAAVQSGLRCADLAGEYLAASDCRYDAKA